VITSLRLPSALDAAVRAELDSFGVVKTAQALGDLQVLQERRRRALRVHLGTDVKAGLALLRRAIEV
jgi:transaldolase / glucose-6-phosphate isomerase